jgi:hypothetical protein
MQIAPIRKLEGPATLNNEMRLAALQCGKACLNDLETLFYGGYASAVCRSGGAVSESKVELPVRQNLTALGGGKPRHHGMWPTAL